MKLPRRKRLRLKDYDYGQDGSYFITICTQKRLCLFGSVKNRQLVLSHAGEMVYKAFAQISQIYPTIKVDKFVVMPNHLHAIMTIQNKDNLPPLTISECIQRFKSYTTKLYIDGVKQGIYPHFDKKIWHRSFHDSIIKNEASYNRVWHYIDQNPAKWVAKRTPSER